MLRLLLSAVLGTPADAHRFGRCCLICGGPHGRPTLLTAPLDVSWSGSGDVAAAAVSSHGPVGIDVERVNGTGFEGFDAVALAPGEVVCDDEERARTWTRKEAILKATGQGLTVDPRELVVSPPADQPRLVDWAAAPGPVQLRDLPAPVGYSCSVAVLTTETVVVRQHVLTA